MTTIKLDDGKYEFDIDDQTGLMTAARRHGEPWMAGLEQQFSKSFMAALWLIRDLEQAAQPPVPLLTCSETIREAIRVGNAHAAGLAAGLASYARSQGFAAFVAPALSQTLAVWYGSMPESNGKTNWTAILHKGDIASGMTIDRSEYPDRVRYEADRVRWLIGELAEDPFILDYDADKHSGYVSPAAPQTIMRFNIYGTLINPDPNGLYVRYEDHARALAASPQATATQPAQTYREAAAEYNKAHAEFKERFPDPANG